MLPRHPKIDERKRRSWEEYFGGEGNSSEKDRSNQRRKAPLRAVRQRESGSPPVKVNERGQIRRRGFASIN